MIRKGFFMKKQKLLFVLVVACLFFSPFDLVAGEDESARASLQRLEGIYVSIEELPLEFRNELNEDQIRAGVEILLRRAGIKISSKSEGVEIPEVPNFTVFVDMIKGKSGPLYLRIVAELNQEVHLARDPMIKVVVATWSTGFIGTVGRFDPMQILDIIVDLVEKFVDVYSVANPKDGRQARPRCRELPFSCQRIA
jgi:hypothetical protein